VQLFALCKYNRVVSTMLSATLVQILTATVSGLVSATVGAIVGAIANKFLCASQVQFSKLQLNFSKLQQSCTSNKRF
jgi:hypothetical protein